MNHCGFNIEPICSDVCGDHRSPQTPVEICRNLGICCGFRAVAARGKYPGFILLCTLRSCIQCKSDMNIIISGRETSARPLANASENLAGQVENRPGRVEFCIGYVRDCPVCVSAKNFGFLVWCVFKEIHFKNILCKMMSILLRPQCFHQYKPFLHFWNLGTNFNNIWTQEQEFSFMKMFS